MRRKVINVMMGLFAAVVFGMAGCGGSSNNAPNNKVTVSNAGLAQNVVAGSLVTLDGSQSTGADGSLITYQWSMTTKPVGSAATINNPTTVNPTFTPDLSGQYSLKLVITDTKSVTSESTVTIIASVANAAPVANAGTAQSVVTGAVVTLDGSGSSDANGDLLIYNWSFTSKPAGSSSALSSASIVKPTFTADVAGVYVLNLVVNDGKVNSVAVTVTVTASAPAPTILSISKISADPIANYAGVAYSQPFIVKITDQNGTPIRNQAVNWTADSGGWTIPASTITDVNGQASTYWVTGSSAIPNLTASAGNTQGTAIASFIGSTKSWPIRPDHLAVSYSENFPVATGISRDVTPLTDPTGTYYAVMQWDNGYTGIIRGGSNDDRHIQFSIWNYNGVPSSIVNAGTSLCQDFSHEGSGVMCSNTYPWIVGNTYRFEMTSVASSSSTTDITVYFIDVASGTRKFIATLRQNGTPILTWALSFVEDYILNDMSCLTVLERRAIFGNTKYLVNSTWINASHSGTYLPWDPKTYCANQGYVMRSSGIEMGVGGTFKANSISTSIPVSY